jgi:hypothetical protein
VAPLPPTDDTNVAISDGGDRKVSKRFKIVHVDKDGKTVTEDWVGPMAGPDPRPFPRPNVNINVRSANCGNGGPDGYKEMVINKGPGDKRVMIICNDRIERVVAIGKANMEKSKDIRRMAYVHALESLHHARERVANDERMAADAKRDALESIDDSIKDVEGDMANPD